MKHFNISISRWEEFRTAMLELGKGRMDQRLKIRKLNDDFEAMEALFNMVTEELRTRLLHLSFTKPAEFQRYARQYVIITNKCFTVKNACEGLLQHYGLKLHQLKGSCFLDFTDKDTADYLRCTFTGQGTTVPERQWLELFDDRFMYSVNKLGSGGTLVIRLYQLYIDKKHFKPLYETEPFEKGRLFERKRYEEIIEKIKNEIDALPFTEKVSIKKILGTHSINSTLLKRMFKDHYHCGVYKYQITLRMKAAYDLITKGEKSFKEIAEETGYSHYPAFVKYFKNHYDILPKDLRKMSRLKQRPLKDSLNLQ